MQQVSTNAMVRLLDLLAESGEDFVDEVYEVLFSRRPDAQGGRRCLLALRSGVSKEQILFDLLVSQECRANAVSCVDLQAVFAINDIDSLRSLVDIDPSRLAGTGSTMERLLQADGDTFFAAAYQLLLQRPIDWAGLNHGRHNFAGEQKKLEFLLELYKSDEYNNRGDKVVPGLRDFLERGGLIQAARATGESTNGYRSLIELLELDSEKFIQAAKSALPDISHDDTSLVLPSWTEQPAWARIKILAALFRHSSEINPKIVPPNFWVLGLVYYLSRVPGLRPKAKVWAEKHFSYPYGSPALVAATEPAALALATDATSETLETKPVHPVEESRKREENTIGDLPGLNERYRVLFTRADTLFAYLSRVESP
jgi:hypothetical protein